jgi:hypothetical protein
MTKALRAMDVLRGGVIPEGMVEDPYTFCFVTQAEFTRRCLQRSFDQEQVQKLADLTKASWGKLLKGATG